MLQKKKQQLHTKPPKGKIVDESAKVKDAIKAGVDAYKEERNKI